MGGDIRHRRSAILRLRNYRAAVNMVMQAPRWWELLDRYVRSRGAYPWTVVLRSPVGPIELQLRHPHDVRTVNEVFCRRDYGSSAPRTVIDVGGNIGVAAAFFLSRRPDSRVHIWEPVPHNVDLLRRNLAQFEGRWTLHPRAMAPQAGQASFVVEPVGRYGGLSAYMSVDGREEIIVDCDSVDGALRDVIETDGDVDLVKIDTEGSEPALVAAIPAELRARIGTVLYEMPDGVREA